METKDELVEHLKKWVEVDKKIKDLQRNLKECRKDQKQMTVDLADVMKRHEIDCFNTQDGQIIYSKTTRKGPLNKKHLETALSKFFQNYEQAKQACDYVLETRETKEIEKITRKI
jgi:hypothetical protein